MKQKYKTLNIFSIGNFPLYKCIDSLCKSAMLSLRSAWVSTSQGSHALLKVLEKHWIVKSVFKTLEFGRSIHKALTKYGNSKRKRNHEVSVLNRLWSHRLVEICKQQNYYSNSKFIGHVRETGLYDYAHENVEKTLPYKHIVQLSIDGPNFNWKFSQQVWKNERNELLGRSVKVGSCGFHKLHNVFKDGQCSLDCRLLYFWSFIPIE